MKLSICKDVAAPVPRVRLRQLFQLVAKAEATQEEGAVNLVFTTDPGIRRLNRQFRDIGRATDVLSFRLDEPEGYDGVFGEIYISVDAAARQARQYGHGRYEEYLRLACHGFLHLFGYDHEKPDEQMRMASREKFFLDRLRGVE